MFADGEIPMDEYRYTAEEIACELDACWTFTSGLYLKASELCDWDLLRHAVRAGFGRAETYPDLGPTPYFDPPPTFGITPSPSPAPCY